MLLLTAAPSGASVPAAPAGAALDRGDGLVLEGPLQPVEEEPEEREEREEGAEGGSDRSASPALTS